MNDLIENCTRAELRTIAEFLEWAARDDVTKGEIMESAIELRAQADKMEVGFAEMMKRAIEIRTQADQLADRKPDVKPVAYVVVSDNSDGSLAGVEGMTHYKFIGPLQHLPLGRHGLVLAAHLQTEQSMHAAWRKRAEEAETRLAHDLAPPDLAARVKELEELLQEMLTAIEQPSSIEMFRRFGDGLIDHVRAALAKGE